MLDEVGRVRSQFDIDDTPNSHADIAHHSTIHQLPAEHTTNTEATTPGTVRVDDNLQEVVAPPPSSPHAEERPFNPRKRKLDEHVFAAALSELENVATADHLPSQPLLVEVVKYFCISFHHWIPYLHKQRLCDTVTGIRSEARSDLVLHALVAVTLRHMDRQTICMDEDEVLRQTKISRFIVETLALRNMSLESLQALILIVFDYVSK